MKKLTLTLVLILTLILTLMPITHALDLGDLGDMFGVEIPDEVEDLFEEDEDDKDDEEDDDDDVPMTFTGKLIDVTLDGTTFTVHEDFKALMDEYEAFYDEYIEIMSDDDPDTMQMLEFLGRLDQISEELDALEDADLDNGDALYYSAVMLRISAKLSEIE